MDYVRGVRRICVVFMFSSICKYSVNDGEWDIPGVASITELIIHGESLRHFATVFSLLLCGSRRLADGLLHGRQYITTAQAPRELTIPPV